MATWVKSIIRLAAVLLAAAPAIASLSDIHIEKLPQQDSVREAMAEASAVAQFAQSWSDKWHYQTPKDQVASQLRDSLDKLQKAIAAAPDNPELLLLTGLVAHYAYNVDVEDAYDLAVKSYQQARQLAPDDYRAEWFLGIHECEGAQVNPGMKLLMGLEDHWAWNRLPADFWGDYMFCASVANMPSHLLRAGDHLAKLHAPTSEVIDFLVDTARKRYQAPDLDATYSKEQVWESHQVESRWVFTSYMCGFAFSPLGEWRMKLMTQKGTCAVQLGTGPHPSRAGDIKPTLLILARQPKPKETLSDFLHSFAHDPAAKPIAVPRCLSGQSLSAEVTRPNAYGAAGNGYGLWLAFERPAPEFPGLLFERPAGPEAPKDGKVSYFHPNERIHRLEGTLYYLVLLDTPDSVLNEAKKDYDELLSHLVVE